MKALHFVMMSFFVLGVVDNPTNAQERKAEPKLVGTLRHPKLRMSARDIVFSPDGQILATAHINGDVILWEIARDKHFMMQTCHGRDKMVYSIDFSPDGRQLATSGEDRCVRLWDVKTHNNTVTFDGISDRLLYSPDGKSLCLTFNDIRDLKTLEKRPSPEFVLGGYSTYAYDPKGKLWLATMNNEVKYSVSLTDTETGKRTLTCSGHSSRIWRVAFSPDCRAFASTGDDHTIRLVNTDTGKDMAVYKDQPGRACCLQFCPDGGLLAYGYKHLKDDGAEDRPANGSIRLLEIPSGKVLATLTADRGPIGPIAFSPDGSLLAAGGFDEAVHVWLLPKEWTGKK
jgi:WD40 repeat protein